MGWHYSKNKHAKCTAKAHKYPVHGWGMLNALSLRETYIFCIVISFLAAFLYFVGVRA